MMPRKKSVQPATASTVLEFFRERELSTAEVVLELASAEVAKRRPAATAGTSTPVRTVRTRTPKRPPAAPAEYGESLKDA
jgi:hypothetical protein